MSDTTDTGRSAPIVPRRRRFLTRENRLFLIVACLISIVCILVGGHLYGRYLSARDLGGRDNAIAQLDAENQGIKRQLDAKSALATELDAKLRQVQASLDAITPSANTYTINPNQSLIVGDGHLTIGMVGAPGNDSVTLNINGKEQALGAGQVANVAPESSINCQVEVQSFDMFKAVLSASCSGAKPQ